MNRQCFPSSLFPLRGDISAEAGATTVTVIGIQKIPVVSPPVEPVDGDTFVYNAYTNQWLYASPWDIPIGSVLEFTGYGYGTAAISWLASDTLAVGDGTPGDISGGLGLTALLLYSSPSTYDYGYGDDSFFTTIYSGATQNWNLVLPATPGLPGQVLATDGTGKTYWYTLPPC